MPCYDPRDRNSSCDDNSSEIRELRERLDKLTRLLCTLTDTIDLSAVKDSQLMDWILEHREFDVKRKRSLNDTFKDVYKDKLK